MAVRRLDSARRQPLHATANPWLEGAQLLAVYAILAMVFSLLQDPNAGQHP